MLASVLLSETPHDHSQKFRIQQTYIIKLPLDIGVNYIVYIEDNTWLLGDMKFIFECSTRYLTSERSERVRYRFEHVLLIL